MCHILNNKDYERYKMTQEFKQYDYKLLDFNETEIKPRTRAEVRKYANLDDFMLDLNTYGGLGFRYCNVIGENKDIVLLEREDIEPGIQISYLVQVIRGLIEKKQPAKRLFGIGNGNGTAESAAYITALNDLVVALGLESEIADEQQYAV